jgi:hypothetical protein
MVRVAGLIGPSVFARPGRLARSFTLAVTLGAMLLTLMPGTASAASMGAHASLTPNVQYLNDATGTTFTLAVKNVGSASLGAVQISRPFALWSIQACPSAPAGWSTLATSTLCRWTSGASVADDIAPGQTRTFTLRARTGPGTQNKFGSWKVLVSRTNSFNNAINVKQAAAMAPGLKVKAYSFQILSAVLTDSPPAAGSPCPAGSNAALTGSGGHYMVICGRNRTTLTLTPKASRSSLDGTFVASHGSFSSGPIAPSTTSKVLGVWSNVVVTPVAGSGKNVVATIGASRRRTSPPTTLDGYIAQNTAPVVTTSAGTTNYTENNPPVAIDPGLTVSDSDPTLEGAIVRISGGFVSSTDTLGFTDQNGITGSYDSGTGVLTLSGTSSLANYQAALRSVTYVNSSDNPTTSRTVAFRASDAVGYGAEAYKSLSITPVNDGPVVTTSGGTASYTENGSGVAVDPGLTVSDVDSANLANATVSITTNFSSTDGDTLNFTNQNGITGSYNSGTGVLTLTGTASVANYQTALRSITFSTTSDNPSTATRTVMFQVQDSSLGSSNAATRNVTVGPVNDAPVVTTSAGNTAATEGASAVAIDGSLTVADADDTNIDGGQVRVSVGFQTGDTLDFTNTANISGVYNSGTGVLTLTGTDTVAAYQAALRSVGFRTTNDNPTTSKTIEFKVSDGSLDSNAATKGITVTGVNDAPTVDNAPGTTAYNEGGAAVAVDSNVTVSDPDSTTLASAAVWISANFSSADGDSLNYTDQNGINGTYNSSTGVLTLIGSASVANYQTALRSITFSVTTENPSSATRTVSFKVNDGSADSNFDTRAVSVTPGNDPPTVTTSAGSTAATEGAAGVVIDAAVTVADPDDTNIESGQVRISVGFQSGDSLDFTDTANVHGVYNSSTGVLALTPIGSATLAQFQSALQSVKFSTTNDNPSTSKTVEFKVNDGDADSNLATKGVTVTGVNDAPTVDTAAGAATYTEGGSPTAVDANVTVTDPDSTTIASGVVSITGNFSSTDGDSLNFTDQNGISGVYNSGTGVLTLTGTASVANYQTALRSITFSLTSDNPSTATRTVSFKVNDGSADSNTDTRDVSVSAADDAPVVTTSAGNTAYTEEGASVVIDGGVTVTDVDDANIDSGQVRISANFQAGDALDFTDTPTVHGVYNSGTGVLTLTDIGTATKADFEAALRSIKFQTTNPNPTGTKTVEFKVNDGDLDSNLATKVVDITGANDAPVVTTSGGNATFTEGGSPAVVDGGLSVTDGDSTNLSGATVSISANFTSADGDTLNFTNQNNISGVYNSGTGVLTLTGADTVANYQTALRSITFSNTSDNPSTATRTVSFQVTDDLAAPSNVATRDVTVAGSDDAPVVTSTGGDTAYTEGDPGVEIDNGLTVADPDDTNIESAQVRISVGFDAGDDLEFTNQNGISGVYNTGTGVLTLTGSSNLANYQTALRSIKFASTNNNPTQSKTVEFKVNDGDLDSNLATKGIAVTRVNSAPIVTPDGSALAYTENDPATAVSPGLTVVEPESQTIDGASASITANFANGEDTLAWTDNNLADLIVAGAPDPTGQTINLIGVGTAAEYQAALRAVTYVNSSEAPSTLARTVTFSATDTNVPAATGIGTRTINVASVDDNPVAVDDAATLLEDAAATAVAVLTNDTDIDGGPKTIASASDPANGTVVLTGGSPGAHTGLTYQPDPNYCNDPPGTTPDTFQYTLNGGSTATVSMTVTCVNDAPVADDETFNGTNSAVGNTALVVNDPTDAAPSESGPKKSISGDILDGDTDVDGPGPLAITPVTDQATANGGKVTIEADGDFIYVSDPADACAPTSDTFTYTVNDGGTPNGTDTATVTIGLSGCVWYVNNTASGTGTSRAPFATLAQAQTASAAGHTIFIFDGDNTTTGYAAGIDLKDNQVLQGETVDLVIGLDTLWTGVPANRPTLTDNNADVVALASGNTVKGLDIDPQGTGGGIAAGTNDNGGTIRNVNITDTGTAGSEPGLEIEAVFANSTWNIFDLAVDNSAATAPGTNSKGIYLHGPATATVNFDAASTITLNIKGAAALDADTIKLGSSGNVATFDSITVGGSGSGGIRLFNLTAGSTTQLGDGSGADLNLVTTSGATAALLMSSGGSVSVPSAGTANISATGGPAIDTSGTTITSLAFDNVSSTNSASNGVRLTDLGAGTFSATGGTISGVVAGFTSFVVSNGAANGTGNISYAGTLGNGAGQALAISGRSGGTVDITGPIQDTNDAGGGILVTSNSGGVTNITNASVTINTTTSGGTNNPINNAITFSGSDGHTLNISGGNLDIDAGAGNGKGIDAQVSGTLNITGSNNTIVTTTGVALSLLDTDIGASGLTFLSINAGTTSGGPTKGISLNNTGSSGGLTVTGSGSTDGSGGTIQDAPAGSTMTRGIELISTRNVSISNMNLTSANRVQGAVSDGVTGGNENTDENGAIHLSAATNVALTNINITGATLQHGINGNNVTNLDLTDVSISSSGDAVWESGIFLFHLKGLPSASQNSVWTNVDITDSAQFNVSIINASATGSGEKDKLTIQSGSTFTNSGKNVIGDHVSIFNSGTANFQVVVDTVTFTSKAGGEYAGAHTSDGIQVDVSGVSAKSDATVTGSTFTGDGAGQSAINISATTGTGTFLLQNNNAVVRATVGINLAVTGSATLSGTISGNTLGTNVTNNPSSGINIVEDTSSGTITVDVSNNTIQGSDGAARFDYGIRAGARAGSGQVHITLAGNTVQSGKSAGIWLFSGNNTGGETSRTCVNFSTANKNSIRGDAGTKFADYFLEQYTGTTFNIQGLIGSGTNASNVNAFVASTDAVAGKVVNSSGGTAVNYSNATCNTP